MDSKTSMSKLSSSRKDPFINEIKSVLIKRQKEHAPFGGRDRELFQKREEKEKNYRSRFKSLPIEYRSREIPKEILINQQWLILNPSLIKPVFTPITRKLDSSLDTPYTQKIGGKGYYFLQDREDNPLIREYFDQEDMPQLYAQFLQDKDLVQVWYKDCCQLGEKEEIIILRRPLDQLPSHLEINRPLFQIEPLDLQPQEIIGWRRSEEYPAEDLKKLIKPSENQEEIYRQLIKMYGPFNCLKIGGY